MKQKKKKKSRLLGKTNIDCWIGRDVMRKGTQVRMCSLSTPFLVNVSTGS